MSPERQSNYMLLAWNLLGSVSAVLYRNLEASSAEIELQLAECMLCKPSTLASTYESCQYSLGVRTWSRSPISPAYSRSSPRLSWQVRAGSRARSRERSPQLGAALRSVGGGQRWLCPTSEASRNAAGKASARLAPSTSKQMLGFGSLL